MLLAWKVFCIVGRPDLFSQSNLVWAPSTCNYNKNKKGDRLLINFKTVGGVFNTMKPLTGLQAYLAVLELIRPLEACTHADLKLARWVFWKLFESRSLVGRLFFHWCCPPFQETYLFGHLARQPSWNTYAADSWNDPMSETEALQTNWIWIQFTLAKPVVFEPMLTFDIVSGSDQSAQSRQKPPGCSPNVCAVKAVADSCMCHRAKTEGTDSVWNYCVLQYVLSQYG